MAYYLLCAFVFFAAYFLNMFYITVFYHRGLTHGAVKLSPWAEKLVIYTGNWVTGLDPKGWSCMHRLHHMYSDTPKDPHSPKYFGIFPLMLAQLHSYNDTLRSLKKRVEPHTTLMRDLDFPISWLNRNRLWALPYILHAAIGLAIGLGFHAWLLGLAYWYGIMSHPVQGWMVNAFGHRYGYRNFDLHDESRNNTIVAWLCAGEGYQNNHHQAPTAAKFSVRWFEIDPGYLMCHVARVFGMIEFV